MLIDARHALVYSLSLVSDFSHVALCTLAFDCTRKDAVVFTYSELVCSVVVKYYSILFKPQSIEVFECNAVSFNRTRFIYCVQIKEG